MSSGGGGMRCPECASVLVVEHVYERWFEDPRYFHTCDTPDCSRQDDDFGPAEYEPTERDLDRMNSGEPFGWRFDRDSGRYTR